MIFLNWFNSLKISRKLITLILLVNFIILSLVGGVNLLWELHYSRTDLTQKTDALTNLVADRSSAALAFDDEILAQENLKSFQAITHIELACLYHTDFQLLAAYQRANKEKIYCPEIKMMDEQQYFSEDALHIYKKVYQGEQFYGWIHVLSNLTPINIRIKETLWFSLFAIMAAIIISVLLTRRIQRLISAPIESITEVARSIESDGYHNRRTQIQSQDEIGHLALSFNSMLDTLESQNQQLIAAKDKQLESANLYRSLIDSTSTIPWTLDPHSWCFTFIGQQVEHTLGYPIQEWYKPGFWYDHLHPDDYGQFYIVQRNASQGIDHQLEYRLIAADGSVVWIHNDVKVIYDDKKLVRLHGFMFDITERKRQEEAIKDISVGVSAQTGDTFFQHLVLQLSKLFDVECVLIGLLDKEQANRVNTLVMTHQGKIVQNVSYDLKDTPCENVVGKQICVYPENVQALFPKDSMILEMNMQSYIGIPFQDSKHQPLGHIVLLDNKPLKQVENMTEVLQIFAARVAAEIERATADQALIKKEIEQREILDSMLDAIISIDETGTILSFNRAAEKLFEYKAFEVIGENVTTLMPPRYANRHKEHLKYFINHDSTIILDSAREVEGKRKSGVEFPLRISIAELPKDADGNRRFIGSCMDLSYIKEQQEMIRRTQKMDALGKLTGGIAHDFNNMLGVIIGYADLLKGIVKENPKIEKYVNEISNATKRGSKLTQKLLAFSRKKISDAKTVYINQLLIDEQHMLEKTLTPRINLILELFDDLWPVFIDVNDFEDALLNLCINAMHAIEGNGTIIIKTENVTFNKAQANQLNLEPGDYALLTLTDNGCGMDKEIQERIFDPFFTTKGDKGTGLGLSQVYGFVERSKGRIHVDSALGEGTNIAIYFHRYLELKDSSEEPLIDESSKLKGNESILVVDDEAALIELTKEILSAYGYNIYTALSGKEALEVLAQHSVDLLLSDIIMPEMNGFQLADNVAKQYPDVKIQFVSGFTDDKHAGIINEELQKNILYKPYKPQELLKVLRNMLDT